MLRKHFEAALARRAEAGLDLPHTVRSWYEHWTSLLKERNVPQYRLDDYAKHIDGYVMPAHGDILLTDVGDHLVEFQHTLLHQPLTAHAVQRRRKRTEEGEGEARSTLGVKTLKNVLASYRAMLRDAVDEKVLDVNPFIGRRLRWEDYQTDDDEAEPDPFTAQERDRLLAYFMEAAAPLAHDLARRIQAGPDDIVRQALGGH